MSPKLLSLALGVTLTLAAAGAAVAQSGVEVETAPPPPKPKFEIFLPEAPGTVITRPMDSNIYSGDPVILYDPVFIGPFTTETETGRMGLASWGSPVGVVTFDAPNHMRQPGWWSFGFAISWGGPVRKTAVTPVSAPR